MSFFPELRFDQLIDENGATGNLRERVCEGELEPCAENIFSAKAALLTDETATEHERNSDKVKHGEPAHEMVIEP